MNSLRNQVLFRCVITFAKQLSEAGLELGFLLDSLIAPDVVRVIEESRDQLVEALKYRANVSITWLKLPPIIQC